jgi:hypothetical protein
MSSEEYLLKRPLCGRKERDSQWRVFVLGFFCVEEDLQRSKFWVGYAGAELVKRRVFFGF